MARMKREKKKKRTFREVKEWHGMEINGGLHSMMMMKNIVWLLYSNQKVVFKNDNLNYIDEKKRFKNFILHRRNHLAFALAYSAVLYYSGLVH